MEHTIKRGVFFNESTRVTLIYFCDNILARTAAIQSYIKSDT